MESRPSGKIRIHGSTRGPRMIAYDARQGENPRTHSAARDSCNFCLLTSYF